MSMNTMSMSNDNSFSVKIKITLLRSILISILLAGCTCPYHLYSASQNSDTAGLYVSVEGDDSNVGSIEKPFLTIARAQQAVRDIKKKGFCGDIAVNFRGGSYRLNQVVEFTSEDGGTSGHSVTYRAYADEKVIWDGGIKIEKWIQFKDNIWYAELPTVKSGDWWFRDLFVDGRRCVRSRFPNAGQMLRILDIRDTKVGDLLARQTFVFDQTLPVSNLAGSEAEMVTFHIWSISRTPIMNSIDKEVSTFYPVGWVGHFWTSAQKDRLAYLENAFEFIDVPDEWYLDRDAGRIYYMAAEGSNPNTMNFTAPVLDQLVVIKGAVREPVKALRFKKIAFENSGWRMPLGGYNGIQAGIHGYRYIDDPTYCLKPAILCEYAQDTVFDECRFAQMGSSGLALGKGCHRNSINQSEFFEVGGTAVQIGWCDKVDDPPRQLFENDWKNSADAPQDNQIQHCRIHQCASVQLDCVGIFVAFSTNTKILYNQISELPYTGISLGYCWHDQKTTHRRSEVAYNNIHDVMQLLDDGGAIYTIGYQPGSTIHHNIVRNVKHGHGYYADECSSHILIENNVFYNLGKDGMFLKGHYNTIKNNIIAVPKRFCVFSSVPLYDGGGFRTDLTGSKRESSFLIENNVLVVQNEGQYFGGQWNEGQHIRLNNLGWNSSADDGGSSQKEMMYAPQELLIADPLIGNIEQGDYSLKENSPAYKIGFQNIQLSPTPSSKK